MAEGKVQHQLRILIDPSGRKLAEKIFEEYIRRETGDFSRFPEFMLALDHLVSEFGGEPLPEKKEDQHNPKSSSKPKEFEGDDADVDIHAEHSSVDYVKNA